MLADADTLCQSLTKGRTVFHALYLNERGFRQALTHQALNLEGFAMLAASEQFLKKNNNRTIDESLSDLRTFSRLFKEQGMNFSRLMISTAFGDALEGRKDTEQVLALCDRALGILASENSLPEEVTFADTTGWGNADRVRRLISEFRSRHPAIQPGLHLHDTRGTGMANVYQGLLSGVSRFDCSVAGMGGCPFAPGAAGNVPTEDVAFLAEELPLPVSIWNDILNAQN